jgi:uracil-DNA glycosylase family 4
METATDPARPRRRARPAASSFTPAGRPGRSPGREGYCRVAGRNHRAGAGLWIVGDDHGTAQRKSPRDDPRIVSPSEQGWQPAGLPMSGPARLASMPIAERCAGCRSRMEILEPYGDPTSSVVIVGEDQRWIGVPFVEPFRSPAGRVLHKALREAGFREDQLLFTNAVACARSDLLDRPTIKDMLACRDRLIREVEAHPRAVIVTLGATAFRVLMGQPSLEVRGHPGRAFETPWGPLVLTLEASVLTRASQTARAPRGPEVRLRHRAPDPGRPRDGPLPGR